MHRNPMEKISRYISIIHPIKLSHVHRRKRLVLIFVLIWSVGMLMASPNLFLLTLHELAHRSGHVVCGLSDHYSHSKWIVAYKYIESIFFFFIPIFVQVRVLIGLSSSILFTSVNEFEHRII